MDLITPAMTDFLGCNQIKSEMQMEGGQTKKGNRKVLACHECVPSFLSGVEKVVDYVKLLMHT